MKLPRWLMIGLWTSIVLAVLAAAGWWWVTWPERTARKFMYLFQEGQWEEVDRMIRPEPTFKVTKTKEIEDFVRSLQLEMVCPRKLLDIARARQGFRLLRQSGEEHSVLIAERWYVLEGDPADRKSGFGFE